MTMAIERGDGPSTRSPSISTLSDVVVLKIKPGLSWAQKVDPCRVFGELFIKKSILVPNFGGQGQKSTS